MLNERQLHKDVDTYNGHKSLVTTTLTTNKESLPRKLNEDGSSDNSGILSKNAILKHVQECNFDNKSRLRKV